MAPILRINDLKKTYDGGFQALKGVTLDIEEGEILALLGPNGAGKTTLISTVCGITVPSSGTVTVGGHDIITDYRKARDQIGLVPQEINLEPFEKVWNTVRLSRGLFGKPRNDALLEDLLRRLSLWDKKDNRVRELSGGMKRRVLIAKALAHRPKVLFLDEPTAGVDVALRREMWQVVEGLRKDGVTIILTTHYLEEAEEMADRIGVINHGRLLLVKPKDELMGEFGRKTLTIELDTALEAIPSALAGRGLELAQDGRHLRYDYDTRADRTGIARLLGDLAAQGITVRDVSTKQSSLEEVFISLVDDGDKNSAAEDAA